MRPYRLYLCGVIVLLWIVGICVWITLDPRHGAGG